MGLGLAVNGLGFVGLAYAKSYPQALACAITAGFGGSFYHPAATALVARLFPAETGKALGLAAIGAGAGMFLGPIYTGWRAGTTGSWRPPVLELGALGLVAAALFMWLAEESSAARDGATSRRNAATPVFPKLSLWFWFIGVSLAFSLRDFAGGSMGSLGSLFLQQAHGFSLKGTGLALSCMYLVAIVSNPLFGGLSDGGRKRWSTLLLVLAAAMIFLLPRVPRAALVPVLAAYGFFFLASYPIVEAALMEAVPDAVRGRVFGFFIMVSGLVGNLAHWASGKWVRALGPGANSARSYYPGYSLLSVMVLLSLAGLGCLQAIRLNERKNVLGKEPELGQGERVEPV